jgi:ABC-2 type transport system permease protein
VEMVMMVTMAFAISALTVKNSLSIGFTLFLYFTGYFWVELLREFDVQWGKYLLFANLDLATYLFGGFPAFDGMTLGFSLAMLAVHYVLFVFLAWWGFARREVI